MWAFTWPASVKLVLSKWMSVPPSVTVSGMGSLVGGDSVWLGGVKSFSVCTSLTGTQRKCAPRKSSATLWYLGSLHAWYDWSVEKYHLSATFLSTSGRAA